MMERRDFLRAGLATTGMALLTKHSSARPMNEIGVRPKAPFKLRYASHFGMFKHSAGDDLIEQLKFMADQGFMALEDNGMRSHRDAETQTRIADEMSRLGMTMGVFVANDIDWREPKITTGDTAIREAFLQNIRDSVEVAKRVNAQWMTVVPGCVAGNQEMGYQTAHVIESLKQASAILEPHGLVMVLEPLNFRDHPNLFLTKMAQAYEICKAVGSPACKILDDLYHQQVSEGNLIDNIDRCWDEIAYFQIGDNPGRKEPTTGEIHYKNVFKHIHAKGYKGLLGMEHGNSIQGKEGEDSLIAAYREVDSF